jgi:hypothetical protein
MDPAEPIDRIDPRDAIERIDSSDATDHSEVEGMRRA